MTNIVISIKNNQLTTTSKNIADIFEKEHKNILRDIQNLDIPENFRKLNFEPSTYKSKNRNNQMLPCYEITRDGFTLLAMGFTGKKALKWKIKYIEAFNKMEQALQNQLPTQTQIPTLKTIGGLVKKCCAAVVRDEINKILNPEKVEHWEVNDNDLILQLYRWHATLNKSETLEFRRLHAENDLLRQKLEEVKKVLG